MPHSYRAVARLGLASTAMLFLASCAASDEAGAPPSLDGTPASLATAARDGACDRLTWRIDPAPTIARDLACAIVLAATRDLPRAGLLRVDRYPAGGGSPAPPATLARTERARVDHDLVDIDRITAALVLHQPGPAQDPVHGAAWHIGLVDDAGRVRLEILVDSLSGRSVLQVPHAPIGR